MAKHKATDDEIIEALKTKSQAETARHFGLHRRTLERRLKRMVRKGYSPEHGMTHLVPEGYQVKGVSSYYGQDGKLRGQWVKSAIDAAQQEAILNAALAGMKDEIPREMPWDICRPFQEEKLLNCYILTDYHMGMLCWPEETGGPAWDLHTAEELLVKWYEKAINQAPEAQHCVFAQLSDFLHFDGMEPLTPRGRHLLDVDTRFAKLVRAAIRVLRRVIHLLLSKHQFVHIIMADSNHDPVSQIWLREWFAVMYELEPRVTVDCSPSPYNAYEFGSVALFFHHGHQRRVGDVSEVFASKFRELFGRTKYAYAHLGHLHHTDVKENNLMVVEQHRTLAPNDAYSARAGWMAGRDAKVITYHKNYGEVARLTISSEMVR